MFHPRLLPFFLLASFMPALVFAGPPYITEDPYPAQLHQLQIYLYGQVNYPKHTSLVYFPALEMDYGYIPGAEFHVVVPALAFLPSTGPRAFGLSDVEVNIKYVLINEREYFPQIATAPTIELPTGDANRNLGNGRTWYKLPLWIGKTWGAWSTYGGYGYVFNSAPGAYNFPFGGWVLTRNVNEQLQLGIEVYAQGALFNDRLPPFQDTGAYTLLNLGVSYRYSKPLSFLLTAGHNIAGINQWYSYFALFWELNM